MILQAGPPFDSQSVFSQGQLGGHRLFVVWRADNSYVSKHGKNCTCQHAGIDFFLLILDGCSLEVRKKTDEDQQDRSFSYQMGASKNNGTPKIIHLFIGFGTIIFTIHFGGKIPLFLVQHPNSLLEAICG